MCAEDGAWCCGCCRFGDGGLITERVDGVDRELGYCNNYQSTMVSYAEWIRLAFVIRMQNTIHTISTLHLKQEHN